MEKAIWFSRHEPTAAQKAEIEKRGYKLIHVEEGKRLGSMPINSEEDLSIIIAEICALEPDAVFGVFPAPLQGEITEKAATNWLNGTSSVPCFEAWNVNRAPEGERPQFTHKRFVWVGDL